jgi:hypothetical protein
MYHVLIALALSVCLGIAGAADANPIFRHGGHEHPTSGGGISGSPQACDPNSTNVCAQFVSGQTFVTWPDVATGSAGNDWRYWIYRSNAPITAGNYALATNFASYVFNNSGQLNGGSPDINLGTPYTQANRQANNSSNPMALIADLTNGGTKQLAYGTGLQVYTTQASEDAYYAVVAASCPAGVCPATPSFTYIGSVGPIGESVQTPQPIKFADSLSRPGQTFGKITATLPTNYPMVFSAHASESGGGAATNNLWGDYYEWFGQKDESWQDGRATTLDVLQDNAGHIPSLPHSIEVGNRDTIWTPLGTGGMETLHFGIGMTPNPLVGAANKIYPTTKTSIERELTWVISHYGIDTNQIHGKGQSMGAWWGALAGIRSTNPHFASLFLSYPVWRQDMASPAHPAGLTWSGTMPFRATLGTAPNTMGTDTSAMPMVSGGVFGGTGGYADIPSFVQASPGTDLPFVAWMISKDDANYCVPGSCSALQGQVTFADSINMTNAMQAAHRGHAFVFDMGHHDVLGTGAIDCNAALKDSAVCYGMNLFALNVPYIAFDHSSIDDNMGTGARDGNGIVDGDIVGCINCGFKWTVTSDTSGAFNFTVSNAWMARAATVIPATTLSGSLTSGATGAQAVITDTSSFLTVGGNNNIYFRIGNEIVKVNAFSTGSITILARGQLGTTAQSHSPGEAVTQLASQPTGPNSGAVSSMTVNATPRRVQNFKPANGATVSCAVTPFGGSPATMTAIVANGLWTITGAPINSGGSTSILCAG